MATTRAIHGPPRSRARRIGGARMAALLARSLSIGQPACPDRAPTPSTAEAAASPGVFGERGVELGSAEVRPQRVARDQLGVGRLPDQEVREPVLATRPDHEVWIGKSRGVQL